MAVSGEPGAGCESVWPGSRLAGDLRRGGADTDQVEANTTAGSTSSPLCWTSSPGTATRTANLPLRGRTNRSWKACSPQALRRARRCGHPDHASSRRGLRGVRTPLPKEDIAMTINNRIKSIVRGARYKAQEAEGKAKQTAGEATGNDSLRRQGKTEERKSRLNQFAKKIKDAVTR
jgi:uncharacterized protein YjbJ (UPF0337 family)